jgi:hypothetical protein
MQELNINECVFKVMIADYFVKTEVSGDASAAVVEVHTKQILHISFFFFVKSSCMNCWYVYE